MKWTVRPFWVVLALLYAGLAIASLCYGRYYDSQLGKAAQVFSLKVYRPAQSLEVEPVIRNAKGDPVVEVADLLVDWRAYLSASMWVNGLGFVGAAVAAVGTGWKRLGATAETPSAGA